MCKCSFCWRRWGGGSTLVEADASAPGPTQQADDEAAPERCSVLDIKQEQDKLVLALAATDRAFVALRMSLGSIPEAGALDELAGT